MARLTSTQIQLREDQHHSLTEITKRYKASGYAKASMSYFIRVAVDELLKQGVKKKHLSPRKNAGSS